jgi:cysteine desulfurase
MEELPANMEHARKLRDRLISGIMKRVDQVTLTGHPEKRLPGHASFCVAAIEGESLIFMLSREGIYANTGSACASKALKTSPVLVAIGTPADLAQGSIVFTLAPSNNIDEMEYVLEKFPPVVERLRAMSPIWREQAAA